MTPDEIAAQLSDPSRSESPATFPQDAGARTHPGMYSWWCDETGLSTLGRVLDAELPALIYAGQAGASSAVAGKEYSSTLASRIRSNHIRGNIRGSTFRRTLAAVLRDPLKLEVVGTLLSPDSNARLSEWLCGHLRVTAVPIPQRELLDGLETEVLRTLDPPLNLSKMPKSPVRAKVSHLRSKLVP